MTHTTTTFNSVSRIEFQFHSDASDPTYSYLRLVIYDGESRRDHTIAFFASSSSACDHLSRIWSACQTATLPDPEPEPGPFISLMNRYLRNTSND